MDRRTKPSPRNSSCRASFRCVSFVWLLRNDTHNDDAPASQRATKTGNALVQTRHRRCCAFFYSVNEYALIGRTIPPWYCPGVNLNMCLCVVCANSLCDCILFGSSVSAMCAICCRFELHIVNARKYVHDAWSWHTTFVLGLSCISPSWIDKCRA